MTNARLTWALEYCRKVECGRVSALQAWMLKYKTGGNKAKRLRSVAHDALFATNQDRYVPLLGCTVGVPLCRHEVDNVEQAMMVCHYTNLRPMLCDDNRSKGGSVPATHQLELV